MKKLVAATAALMVFLMSGSLWIGLARLLPEGAPRAAMIVAFGAGFAGVFVWLLVERVRRILKGNGSLLVHAAIAVVELAMMLAAFAAVYQILGLQDKTEPSGTVTYGYWDSLYYSVVTFTTLGYGDFYPRGVGRALAGIQALTGYIILGLLASTTASVLSPYSKAGKGEDADDEQGGD